MILILNDWGKFKKVKKLLEAQRKKTAELGQEITNARQAQAVPAQRLIAGNLISSA
jgi:hypothetical protein